MLLLCGSTHWYDAKARRVVVPIVRHYERGGYRLEEGTSEEKVTGEGREKSSSNASSRLKISARGTS